MYYWSNIIYVMLYKMMFWIFFKIQMTVQLQVHVHKTVWITELAAAISFSHVSIKDKRNHWHIS